MKKAGVTRVRPLIIDLVTQCISEPQPTMRHVVDILERWTVIKAAGAPVPDEINADEAWATVDKVDSSSGFTRSLSSARRGRSNSMFSSTLTVP
jgi:hypothetical protein